MSTVERVRRPGRTAAKYCDPRVVCGVATKIVDGDEALWEAVRLNNRTYNKAIELNREEKRCLELLYRRHCPRLRQLTRLVRKRDDAGKPHKRPWTLVPIAPKYLSAIAALDAETLPKQQYEARRKELANALWTEVSRLKQETLATDDFKLARKRVYEAKRAAGKAFKAAMQREGLYFVSKDETWKEAQPREVDGRRVTPTRFRSLRERRGSLAVERKRCNRPTKSGVVDRPSWGEAVRGEWDAFVMEEIIYSRHVDSINQKRRAFRIRFLLNAKRSQYVTVEAVFWKLPPVTVKIAIAKLTRCQDGIGWGIRLTVEPSAELVGEEQEFFTKPVVGNRKVACDFGWRRLSAGSIRVATFVGDDGQCMEVVLPCGYVRQWEMVAKKQSKIGDDLNRLREFLETRETLPDAFRHWRLFKHAGRFARAFREWRDTNPDRGGLFNTLSEWYSSYQHDERHANGRRDNPVAARNHYYKTFARELTDSYSTLLLDAIGGQQLAKRPRADAALSDWERKGMNEARLQRQMAGFSVLKLALEQSGLQVQRPDCAYTSRICSYCGYRNAKSSDIELTCAKCYKVEDRDVRACKNLLGKTELPLAKMVTHIAKIRAINGRKSKRQRDLATQRV